MTIIEKIENQIEELKNTDLSEYIYKANSLDLSFQGKSYVDVKDVDINNMIKNAILLSLSELEYEEYKEINEKLQKKDYRYLYDLYLENHAPTTIDRFEMAECEGAYAVVTLYGKKAFRKLGLTWTPVMEMKSSDERHDICDNEYNKQVEKHMQKIFSDNFLEDIFPYTEKEIKGIKRCIYNLCENKYDSILYDQKKGLLFCEVPSKRDKRKLLENLTNLSNVFDLMAQTKKTKNSYLSTSRQKEKELNSKIAALEKIKEYVKKEKDLIFNIEKIEFTLLEENEECLDIFKSILIQQQSRFNILKTEEQEITQLENGKELEHLLKKHKINYNNLKESIKKIFASYKDIKELDKNLSLLQVNEIDCENETLVNIIVNSSSKKINTYAYLMQSNIISKETLMKHLEVFGEKEENFKEVSDILLKNNLSSSLSNYDENILFLDCKEVKKNEELLSSYQLEKCSNNFNVLFDAYYYDALDFLLEHSMDIHLLDQQRLTHEEVDNFMKRCQICLNVGIDIYTKSGNINRSFLLGNGFYSTDAALDDYLMYSEQEDTKIKQWIKDNNRNHISDEVYKLNAIENLEKYKSEDALTYDLNGITISRPKVLRNITLFYEHERLNENTLLQAIVYNSNLNEEEITKVHKIALPDYKEKTKDKNYGKY